MGLMGLIRGLVKWSATVDGWVEAQSIFGVANKRAKALTISSHWFANRARLGGVRWWLISQIIISWRIGTNCQAATVFKQSQGLRANIVRAHT